LAQADNTYATGARLLPDGTGVMHVLWLSESTSTGEDRCPMHWDTATGVTTNLLGDPAACAASGISSAGTESGTIHAAWQNDPGWGEEGIYYWNSSMLTATLVTEDGTVSYGFTHKLFAGGGKVHLVYTQDGEWRHWEATEQVSRILSATSTEQRYFMDDSGILRAGWLEDQGSLDEAEWHVYYWDSAVLTKTLISDDPQLLGGRVREFEVGPGNSGQGAALWIQQRADNDDHVLVKWDGTSGSPEIVDTLDANIYGRLGFDDAGQGFATYQANAPGGGHSDIYFWRERSGTITNLSAGAGAGAGDVVNLYGGDTFLLANDAVFVLWMEESGGGEGSDLFAAWFLPPLPEKVFLPAVLR
jgi:hypothetical protein